VDRPLGHTNDRPVQVLRTGTHARRRRYIIWGITSGGVFVDGMTLDAFLAKARRLLRMSGRVYRYGNTIVYEARPGSDDPRLRVLATGGVAESKANTVLATLFVVGVQGKESPCQSILPSILASTLLADDDLPAALPTISYYARRPVFDKEFNLCGPGWHAESRILVHGPEVTPAELPAEGGTGPARHQLPLHLSTLLGEFSWRSAADVANAVAFLLTGLLVNHFVDDPHPMFLVDGNRIGVGKTLLVQVIGRVLDGVEPPRIRLCGDVELEKKLCTRLLHDDRSSLFLLDNIRTRVESALLEQSVLSPVLEFRILGGNKAVKRANTYLWVLTSNDTRATADLINRALPICLHHEGDPRQRAFVGDPLAYASKYRLEILGELAAMVLRWCERGRPLGNQKHRCRHWAQVIGGILNVAGLTDFLTNLDEVEDTMDEGLQLLGELAEHVIGNNLTDCFVVGAEAKAKGQSAKAWAEVFVEAGVAPQEMQKLAGRGRDSWVGRRLAALVGRKTRVTTPSGSGIATLRSRSARANQKLYCFELELAPEEPPMDAVLASDATDLDPIPDVVATQGPIQEAPSVPLVSTSTSGGAEGNDRSAPDVAGG
jgi:hypothetical protein